MAFVLDASVAVGWVVGSQATDYGRRIRQLARSEPYHAPDLWRLEVTNAIRSLVRRRLMRGDPARIAVGILECLAPVLHTVEASALERFDLAARWNVTTYDATYLWLAQSLRLPVACIDGPLAKALKAMGLKRL